MNVLFADLYQEMVSRAKGGEVFVELGTFEGHSAKLMAELIQDSGKEIKFYTVDYFGFYREMDDEWRERNRICDTSRMSYETTLKFLEPVKDYVTVIKQDSWEPIKGVPVCDFCFIDASHEYWDVMRDLKCWLPRSKVIAGDDYGFEGVRLAVDEFLPNATKGQYWVMDPNPYYDDTLLHRS